MRVEGGPKREEIYVHVCVYICMYIYIMLLKCGVGEDS